MRFHKWVWGTRICLYKADKTEFILQYSILWQQKINGLWESERKKNNSGCLLQWVFEGSFPKDIFIGTQFLQKDELETVSVSFAYLFYCSVCTVLHTWHCYFLFCSQFLPLHQHTQSHIYSTGKAKDLDLFLCCRKGGKAGKGRRRLKKLSKWEEQRVFFCWHWQTNGIFLGKVIVTAEGICRCK